MSPEMPRASGPNAVPTVWQRVQVNRRRLRFAALLSRITGQSLDRAWMVFRPLPEGDPSGGADPGN